MAKNARILMDLIVCLILVGTGVGASAQQLDEEDLGRQLQRQAQELETALDEHQIDYAVDSLSTIFAKRAAAKVLLEGYQQEILSRHFDTAIVGLNYPVVRTAASPRLSGRTIRVGPTRAIADLPAALIRAQDGDLILLDAGEYALVADPNARQRVSTLPVNLAIIGAGSDKTTLLTNTIFMRMNNLRVRIEDVRIECNDQPIAELGMGEGLHLRGCYITGYNSGGGGTNAIFGAGGSVFLVEGCVFEGMTGRSSAGGRRSSGGVAFDLRQSYLLFCRQTQFIDNSEISRAKAPEVYDGCVSMNKTSQDSGIMTYLGGPVLLRKNAATLTDRDNSAIQFEYAGDDVSIVRAAADTSVEIETEGERLIQRLQLRRNLPYWIGLIRHEDSEIREIAATQIEALTGMEAAANTENGKEGETLADLGALFAAEQEFTRLITWYEVNRERLHWDTTEERYVLEEAE